MIGACQGVFSARIMNMSESLREQRESEQAEAARRKAAFPPSDPSNNVSCAGPSPPKMNLRGSLLESLVRGVVIKDDNIAASTANMTADGGVQGRSPGDPPPKCDLPPKKEVDMATSAVRAAGAGAKAAAMASASAISAAAAASAKAAAAAKSAAKAGVAASGQILESDVVEAVSDRVRNSTRLKRAADAAARAARDGKAAATIGKAMMPPKEEVIDSLKDNANRLIKNSSALIGDKLDDVLSEERKEQLKKAGELAGAAGAVAKQMLSNQLSDATGKLLGENSSIGDIFKGFPFGRRLYDGLYDEPMGDEEMQKMEMDRMVHMVSMELAEMEDFQRAEWQADAAVDWHPQAAERRLEASAADAADAGLGGWLDSWHNSFECWWMWLPTQTQTQLGGCMGALALHLGSKWDAAMRALGTPRRSGPAAAAPSADCEWVEHSAQQLELPDFPALPSDFQWQLPAIPRLLPRWERLQALSEYQAHTLAAASASHTFGDSVAYHEGGMSNGGGAAFGARPSWSILSASAGGGAALTLAIVALRRARRDRPRMGTVRVTVRVTRGRVQIRGSSNIQGSGRQ